MNIVKSVIALIVSCFIAGNVDAQALELTSEQQKLVKIRVIQAVEEFLDDLSQISNDCLTNKAREEYVNHTLEHFIGNGNPYSYYDEELGVQIHRRGVKIVLGKDGMRSQLLNISR